MQRKRPPREEQATKAREVADLRKDLDASHKALSAARRALEEQRADAERAREEQWRGAEQWARAERERHIHRMETGLAPQQHLEPVERCACADL